jgi:Protein of unknown function (DUF1566)
MRQVMRGALLAATLALASAASGLTAAEKCESAKLKEAGKYGFCRMRAEAKAAKTGEAPDYSKCDHTYGLKWPAIESAGGGMCPSIGDQAALEAFIAKHTDDVAAALAGGPLPDCFPTLKTGQTTSYGTGSDGDLQRGASRSFTDNGDGTITDNATGLMWEKKSDDGSIHDKDDLYTWGMTSSPYTMNGTMVTTFLATLNGGGGFAGYTDWRIPNANELESLRNLENVGPATYSAFNTACVDSCAVTTCSCTRMGGVSNYWTSTTLQYDLYNAWTLTFLDGQLYYNYKSTTGYVRAVRSGS